MCLRTLCKSYTKGMSLSLEACSLDLFYIGTETMKPRYLRDVASFLSQGDGFKVVGFLLFTPCKVFTHR